MTGLSFIPEISMVEDESRLHKLFSDSHGCCTHACIINVIEVVPKLYLSVKFVMLKIEPRVP